MSTSRDPKNHHSHPCINIRKKNFRPLPHHQRSRNCKNLPPMTLRPPMRRILKLGGGGNEYFSRSEKNHSHPCIKIRKTNFRPPHHQRSRNCKNLPPMTLGPPMRRILKPGGGGNVYKLTQNYTLSLCFNIGETKTFDTINKT